MNRFKITLVVFVALMLLSGCGYTEKEHYVIATVTDMKHTPSEIVLIRRFNPALKMRVVRPVQVAEKYEVTISYENISVTIDNQELFDSVNVGSHLAMAVVEYYDKDGNLREQELRLP